MNKKIDEPRLKEQFTAYLSHPSAIRNKVKGIQNGLTKRNSDLKFKNPFDESVVEGDLELLKSRGRKLIIVKDRNFSSRFSAFPNKSRRTRGNIGVLDYTEKSEHPFLIMNQSLNNIISSEGFVSVIDELDSLGSDIETVYALLFDKLVFTICLNEPYVDHPWLTYHANKVFSSEREFENNFRKIVTDYRKIIANGKIFDKALWVRSLLNVPSRKIGAKFTMYLAHATRAMEQTLEFELEFEKKNPNIYLINPFYDLEGGEKDRAIEEARKRKEKVILPFGFDKDVIMKDVGAIEKSNGCLLIVDDFSIGREMELVYANLLRSNPIVAVCSPKLAAHPMIKFHTDYIFTSHDECFEKLPRIVENVRMGTRNKRLEDYHVWLKGRLER